MSSPLDETAALTKSLPNVEISSYDSPSQEAASSTFQISSQEDDNPPHKPEVEESDDTSDVNTNSFQSGVLTKLKPPKIETTPSEVDANPSPTSQSEVDANPISWNSSSTIVRPITIPTPKD